MFPLSLLRLLATRAQLSAVIPKPDQDFRVVHDGTHGVQVNNEIVMLDRLESPAPREICDSEAGHGV